MRRRGFLFSLVVIFASGVIGVAITDRTAGQTPEQLVIGRGSEVSTLDPQRSVDFPVLINIFDTLISRDSSLSLKPGLALSWLAVDSTTWEFALRRGVKFHNGEPFNAEAVKFSFERASNPKNPRAGLLTLIKSVTVVNEYTVRMTTVRPWPLLPAVVASVGYVVPPGYIQTNGEEALIRRPVGTGPYRFVRWVKDDRLELEANDSYWAGRPRIGRIIFRPIPNEGTRSAELLAGSIQLIDLMPPELFGPIEQSSRTKRVSGDSMSLFFIIYNLVNIPQDRPLADKRVRLALNYAVDRQALITALMHNVGVPVSTFCTEVSPGCDASVVPPFTYDPQRARDLLREAGYPNGFAMTIGTTSGAYPGDRDLTMAVAGQLSNVGIKAQVKITEYGVAINQLVNKTAPTDAVFVRYTDFVGYAGGIAMRAFNPKGGVTLYVPGNPELQRLLETAEQTLDESTRRDLYRRAHLLFREEAPAIPLMTAPNVHGMHRDLDWLPRPDLLLKAFDASWKQR